MKRYIHDSNGERGRKREREREKSMYTKTGKGNKSILLVLLFICECEKGTEKALEILWNSIHSFLVCVTEKVRNWP